MNDFATTPLTFTAAQDFLAQKVDLPTALSSLDISLKLPARLRAQSFFSAQVSSANILQALRTEVSAIAQGDYNYAEGRARLKTFLQRQGYGVPPVGSKGEGDIKDLASTRRLDLILRQNVAMAHAVGQREVAENPAVMELLPCYEYSTGPNPRAEHAAFDGLVLPKTDPFWATHYPPWDFNCNCMVLDTEAEPNGKSSGFKAHAPMAGHLDYKGMRQHTDNASGFEFDSTPAAAFGKPDFSAIADEDLRSQVEAAFAKKFPAFGLASLNKASRAKATIGLQAPENAEAIKWLAEERALPNTVVGEDRALEDMNKTALRRVAQAEAALKTYVGGETLAVFDHTGKTKLFKTGIPGQVAFTEAEAKSMRGLVVSHYHDAGGPFSKTDIMMACLFGFKELRAVTPNGVYSLTPSSGVFTPRGLENITKAFDRLYATAQHAKDQVRAASDMWKVIASENNLNYNYTRYELP